MKPSKYSLELWSPSGQLLADLSGRASNRHVVMARNEAEEIDWNLDLGEFEHYARSIGTTSSQLLQPGITEVRVKRLGKYLCGGKLVWREIDLQPEAQTVQLKATGFLNLFTDRYTAPLVTFTNVERTTIAWTLIDSSQSTDATWNFGVTQGSLATLGTYSRQYQNVRIKDALQDLTKLQTAFDFEFTYDKIFNTYAAIGTRRPEIIFEYPGNVMSITSTLDATSIANKLYILGSGIGQEAAVQIESDDLNSQANYKVREKPIILSDVLDSGTLGDYGQAQLAAWGIPFEVPVIEYDGSVGPAVTDYRIGDYVSVRTKGFDLTAQLNGFYRAENLDLTIDENDNEDVKLSLGQ